MDFRTWMIQNNINKKIQGDCISRLKRIEHEIDLCDLDEHFEDDRCEYLMSLFLHMGQNERMEKYPNVNLPIGKYYMSTYRSSLRAYVKFKNENQ